MASSLIGRKLGKYEITGLLGQGGMATVYKGYQADIDRYVAVKVLPPHPGQDSSFNRRFQMEAQLIARLQHPHILPLYDYGDENGVLYLVTAFIDGGSLSQRIQQNAMPLPEIERILTQVASALDYAHRQGVIHRDIKPDNILLDREGNALLADFGIARATEELTRLTATGGLIGTPAYMSPEQARGQTVDKSSDLYSLGVVVYEMLTGRTPFAAPSPVQIILSHINDDPLPPTELKPGLPTALDIVLSHSLAKTPEERYPTATQFAQDFRQAVHAGSTDGTATMMFDSPVTARVTAPMPQVNMTTQTALTQPRVNLLVAIMSVGSVVLLLVVVLLLLNRPLDIDAGDDDTDSVAAPTTAPTVNAPTAVVVAVPTFGELRFATANAIGDTINLRVEGLTPPPNGQVYGVWLQAQEDESPLLLGELRLDALGGGVLTYTDGEGRFLPTLYNTVSITLEQEMGDTPDSAPVYTGSVPAAVSQTLREILITSEDGLPKSSNQSGYSRPTNAEVTETPGELQGLLASVLVEANIAQQHAGLAARASNVGGLHSHAEHTINILLGTTEDRDGSGRGENPGRGVGVGKFLDLMDADLLAVANLPEASRSLQNQVEFIRVCVQNARDRMDEVVSLETRLLAMDSVEAAADSAARSTEAMTAMIDGVDLNQNGQIEPFEGECGLQQIAPFGVLVGNMEIVAGER